MVRTVLSGISLYISLILRSYWQLICKTYLQPPKSIEMLGLLKEHSYLNIFLISKLVLSLSHLIRIKLNPVVIVNAFLNGRA